ncbi:proton-conducting membrane transporter [Mesorhizobium sp. M7A.F.Ca.US.006.04.2.1]|uniref:proton-conducting membrane transporter n=1 Tax=unclassified Mesorhizobium TaxID=325217 RepID=UPI000FCA3D50|nr:MULTISPECIES: proton-conducting membrane transporter [unclassified Mesorhizobium]RUX77392.1 proton-conducting membrane transporter [Mesorhizobium sp. M7A.F.Ca.US.005.03.1.1]RUY16021.1 proton-conducting membrane transporter [Mesorhizobium sp. M7A.F.Ca.US.005.03.2.1]RUY26346.1 proton-conducting membrane transporter [Mesorhizobium sp. M7A.F.Ca.US.001.04.2.1]RUY40175.1 proton-conducting membrane transporter [Mesorhizobium sp. M7A.F.Ca.US.001.04.1.1]RVA08802.1 proton-conducting membrane transpor
MGTFFYVVLAFLIGVLVGWFLWGRLRGELDSLRGDLDRTRSERDRLRTDSDRLTGELDACGKTRADLERRLREASAAPAAGSSAAKPASQAPAALMSTPATAKSATTKPATAKPAAAKAVSAKAVPAKPAAKPAATKTSAPAKSATSKPATVKPATAKPATAKPASGKPDNLRRLIGIGPVNEKLLKAQGVTSFAQIASWTAADIKRIEDVMNFDGRIARERWIEQAKLLAAGNEKEFAKQFPTAGTSSNS